MKLPFRRDGAAALATAQGKLKEIERQLIDLAAERAAALLDSDDLSSVHALDGRIAEAQRDAGVLKEKIATLRAAIRQQQLEKAEQERQAGLAVVAARLKARADLARKVDGILREFEEAWNALLDRSAVISNWPESVPLPRAEDLLDVKPLRLELAWRLYACGRPAWNRDCSVPSPMPPVGVEGLSPRGIVGATEAMGAALLGRLRAQRPAASDDEEVENVA